MLRAAWGRILFVRAAAGKRNDFSGCGEKRSPLPTVAVDGNRDGP
jgi:hypothetical protein